MVFKIDLNYYNNYIEISPSKQNIVNIFQEITPKTLGKLVLDAVGKN